MAYIAGERLRMWRKQHLIPVAEVSVGTQLEDLPTQCIPVIMQTPPVITIERQSESLPPLLSDQLQQYSLGLTDPDASTPELIGRAVACYYASMNSYPKMIHLELSRWAFGAHMGYFITPDGVRIPYAKGAGSYDVCCSNEA